MRQRPPGVAVILALGILTLLTVMAVTFAVSMQLDQQAAGNARDALQAKYLADAGVHEAVALLKTHARTSFVATLSDPWVAPSRTLPGGAGGYDVTVRDTARFLNLNDPQSALPLMLRALHVEGLEAELVSRVLDYRDDLPGRRFARLDQLKLVEGVTPELYEALRELVTLSGWADPNTLASGADRDPQVYRAANLAVQPRSPVNINTAPRRVLAAVLEPLGLSASDADRIAEAIVARRAGEPFETWGAFDGFVDSAGSHVPAPLREAVKRNANPNRLKPQPSTTEFCFHAGGWFEITSTGRAGRLGSPAAERQVRAMVKVFDIWTQSLKEDPDAGGADPSDPMGYFREPSDRDLTFAAGVDEGDGEVIRTTWHDHCPLFSGDDTGLVYRDDYARLYNSVKLGFWDNFDEENDVAAQTGYSFRQWRPGISGQFRIQEKDPGDHVLWTYFDATWEARRDAPNPHFWPVIILGDFVGGGRHPRWDFRDFYLRARLEDEAPGAKGPYVGLPVHRGPPWPCNRCATTFPITSWVLFRKVALQGANADYSTFVSRRDLLAEDSQEYQTWLASQVPPITHLDFLGTQPAVAMHRVWLGPTASGEEPPGGAMSAGPGFFPLDKTFQVTAIGNRVGSTVRWEEGGAVARSDVENVQSNGLLQSGLIGFYGHDCLFDLDDVRVIPRWGAYASSPFDTQAVGIDGAVEWGTVWAAVTVPGLHTAFDWGGPPLAGGLPDPVSEEITLGVRTAADPLMAGAAAWAESGSPPRGPVNLRLARRGGSLASDPRVRAGDRYVQYKAYLTTGHPGMRETPVLEDVQITYLPKTQILSWEEVAE